MASKQATLHKNTYKLIANNGVLQEKRRCNPVNYRLLHDGNDETSPAKTSMQQNGKKRSRVQARQHIETSVPQNYHEKEEVSNGLLHETNDVGESFESDIENEDTAEQRENAEEEDDYDDEEGITIRKKSKIQSRKFLANREVAEQEREDIEQECEDIEQEEEGAQRDYEENEEKNPEEVNESEGEEDRTNIIQLQSATQLKKKLHQTTLRLEKQNKSDSESVRKT